MEKNLLKNQLDIQENNNTQNQMIYPQEALGRN